MLDKLLAGLFGTGDINGWFELGLRLLPTIGLVALAVWLWRRLTGGDEEKGAGGPKKGTEGDSPKKGTGSGNSGGRSSGGGAGGSDQYGLGSLLSDAGAAAGGLVRGAGSLAGGIAGGIVGGIASAGRGFAGGTRSGAPSHRMQGPTTPPVSRGRSTTGPGRAAAGFGFGTGFGFGAGLGAAAAGWVSSQARQAADAARDAYVGWQWSRWHSQGAPAYGWTVYDAAAAQAMSEAFDAAGVRYGWQETAEGWQVVINAEDLESAGEALAGAGLEFQEMGQPIGVDGEPWQPGINDLPEQEGAGADPGAGGAAIFDPESGEWVPVAEPGDWPAGPPVGDLPADTWGDFTGDTWGDFASAGGDGDGGAGGGSLPALPDFGGGSE